MNRNFFILLVFLSLVMPARAVFAEKDIGEGYAEVNFKELAQTAVMMGGFNISDPRVVDEYARLIYCDIYREKYENDVEWNQIRQKIISRAVEKREYYRVLYETTGVFQLARYDFENQYFPFSADTALNNVGSLILMTNTKPKDYCPVRKKTINLFTPNVGLLLSQPLTLNKIKVPLEDVEGMLVRMAESGNIGRQVYGRIRFRATDMGRIAWTKAGKMARRIDLLGEITSIEFYIDPEMTKSIGNTHLTKH